MSGIFLIQPISIPQSAAQNFAGGDVKHVSSIADAIEGDALSNPTRQLAYRDVLLAEKVNELVEVVNNKDQFINLPLPVTTLPGGASQIISNYRIPPGFEARILNAKIASSPAGAVQLTIGYNDNQYGLTTFATQPATTFDEFTAGTAFYGTGEFVIQLLNISGKTATATASVILTMRPVAAQKGGIIGPGAVGPRGDKGDKGDKGDQGNPGLPGPAGPIGMTWRGSWSAVTGYATRDEVQYGGSTWFARSPNTNVPPPATPQDVSVVWDLVAATGTQGSQGVQGSQGTGGGTGTQGFQGSQGNIGPTGAQGSQGSQGVFGAQGNQGNQGNQGQFGVGFRLAGVYDNGLEYLTNDVVTVTDGTTAITYAASADTGPGVPPPGAPWQKLLAPGGGSFFDYKEARSFIQSGADYVPGDATTMYGSIASGSNYPAMDWVETSTYGNLTGYSYNGVSQLRGTKRAIFKGELTIGLPTGPYDGSIREWTGDDVEVLITKHGTIQGTTTPSVEVKSIDSGSFTVISNSDIPVQVQITTIGTKIWPS